MFINENIKVKLPLNKENIYALMDFDRTITSGDSDTSWSLVASYNLLPKEYIIERQNYYNKYRPIEINSDLSSKYKNEQMDIWFKKHLELFIKYGLEEEKTNKLLEDPNVLKLREGAKEFLKYLYECNIPLIIISAGVGNFIEQFLKNNNCLYDNIYIASNNIEFENGIASKVNDSIIHSLNKNEASLPPKIKDNLKNKKQILLIGDQIGDLTMVDINRRKDTLAVAFLNKGVENLKEEYLSNFDIVCESNESYHQLKKVLFK